MPHIIIKAIEGATKEQMQKAAADAVEAVSKTLGKPKKYFSAAVEEYSSANGRACTTSASRATTKLS